MKELKDIRDDQIRIVGKSVEKKGLSRQMLIVIISLVILIIGVTVFIVSQRKTETIIEVLPEQTLFEPMTESKTGSLERIGSDVNSSQDGYTEIIDTVINDIPIRMFIPHNAEMSLHIGMMDREDKDIIYAAQAADVRADNGGIVGAFVMNGEPRAWGLSKKGFCASIDGVVTVGVAENSPLFEQATEKGGYFFRQYPLVCNGQLIDNEPKGKSIRRAICDRQSEIFMVETGTIESFHDFAQALVDLGVDHAVYLVGSSAYGWAVDENGATYEFGEDSYYTGCKKMPANTSYIVWRKTVNN